MPVPFEVIAMRYSTRKPSVAVVGCGHWGKNLVRNLYNLGALEMVCDTTEVGRATAAQIAPGVPIVSSIDEITASAVMIATPASTHYQIARYALETGRDVFVEKPLALTYAQGRQLVQIARDRNRILMVGHVLEYHPAIVRLVEMVHRGDLGTVYYIYSNRLSLGKVRREENILWSFAPHDIAVILRLLGAMPIQVTATGGSYIQPNITDVTVTNLLFDHGVRAHIHVSWLHPFKEQRLVVIGSRKMASFNDIAKELILYDQRVELREGEPIPIRGNGDLIAFDDTEPLRLECEAFLRAIVTREPPLADGESGLQVLRVLQAAQRSLMMNGEPVALGGEL
jgi:predicted dehydrogenase